MLERKIKFALWLGIGLPVLCLGLIVLWGRDVQLRNQHLRKLELSAANLALQLQNRSADELQAYSITPQLNAARDVAHADSSCMIDAHEGTVVAACDFPNGSMAGMKAGDKMEINSEIREAIQKQEVTSTVTRIGDSYYLTATAPVDASHVVHVDLQLQRLFGYRAQHLVPGLLLLMVVAGAGSFISRRIVAPEIFYLKQLAREREAISHQPDTARFTVRSDDNLLGPVTAMANTALDEAQQRLMTERELSCQLAAANEVLREQKQLEGEMRIAFMVTLLKAVESRDETTEKHIERMAVFSHSLALRLGITDKGKLDTIVTAAVMHDVGKINTPDSVLMKPGALTPQERKIIEDHASFGEQLIRHIPGWEVVAAAVGAHHEYWDGTGYPLGREREEIPLVGRILAVADVYDALTSDRPYRKAWPHEQAIEYIAKRANSQFDPEVVQAFNSFSPADWVQLREKADKLQAIMLLK